MNSSTQTEGAKHTPLPWRLVDRSVHSPSRDSRLPFGIEHPMRGCVQPVVDVVAFPPNSEGCIERMKADCELIVQAVNAFPDLVAALKFYANPENWKVQENGFRVKQAKTLLDEGTMARAALIKAKA